jgi:hypothetical protein
MGKIEGSAQDSRIMMRDELGDDSEGEKPWLYGLVKSHSRINYSNVFAKDEHTSATQVCLTESARFQTCCLESVKSHATTIF